MNLAGSFRASTPRQLPERLAGVAPAPGSVGAPGSCCPCSMARVSWPAVGLPLSACGLALRAWAAGHLMKDTRLAVLADGKQIPVSRAGYARLKSFLDR